MIIMLATVSMRAHDLPTVEQLNRMIETGDTVPESGMYNVFVIKGATIKPAMFNSSYFTYIENISGTSVPDSWLCILFRHDNHVAVAARKSYINVLFPEAKQFVVNTQEVKRNQFDRIPASLLLTVTGTDNGHKLTAITRDNVNTSNPDFEALTEAEHKWCEQNYKEIPLQQIPQIEQIVLNKFSTYPTTDTHFFLNGLLRSAEDLEKMNPAEIKSISISDRAGLNVDINSYTLTDGYGDNVLRIPTDKYPSMKLSDYLSMTTKGAPAGNLILEKNTVYIIPYPSQPIREKALQKIMEETLSKMNM